MVEIDIKQFLIKYKNKEIIYIPNPGNAGDSLIAYGTIQVFKEVGLDWKLGNIKNKYENKILFYAGGGNLIGLYKNCENFIKLNKENNEIVILPHTIKSIDNLLLNLNNNITFICREKKSYNYVMKLFRYKENVFLSKDMAFYINNLDQFKIKGNGICNAYRCDCEKTDIIIPPNNVDLSTKLNEAYNTSNLDIIKKVSLKLFKYLSNYEIIKTNRLHIAIAGSLLNKKVLLSKNSYYKNEEIYNYSIKNIYKNTIFVS